jgi:hypothetical protein
MADTKEIQFYPAKIPCKCGGKQLVSPVGERGWECMACQCPASVENSKNADKYHGDPWSDKTGW